jgi:hypothetical protein
MTLTVENGTGVAGANTYVDLADCRAYALARGVVLSVTDSVVETQLILAMDYLEALDYIGAQVSNVQKLSWPRKNILIDPDTPFPSNEIPPNLIAAECQLVIEQFNGVNLQPSYNLTGGAGAILEEKVDVLDTKFSEKIGTTSEPVMPKVIALLRHLVLPIPFLRTVRM